MPLNSRGNGCQKLLCMAISIYKTIPKVIFRVLIYTQKIIWLDCFFYGFCMAKPVALIILEKSAVVYSALAPCFALPPASMQSPATAPALFDSCLLLRMLSTPSG